MEISLDEIKRLEKLSALCSSEEKLQNMVKDFNQIANFVEEIKKAEINEETVYARVLDVTELRKDISMPSMEQKEILANAPEKNDEAFIVPKVVD